MLKKQQSKTVRHGTQHDDPFMSEALAQARMSAHAGEVPIGCVIVCDDSIIARAHNTCEADQNALHHAEIRALESASHVKNNWRLTDCDLYVTVEPCPMCLGALFQSRVRHLYFGCPDPKRARSTAFPSLSSTPTLTDNNHTLAITGGILAEQCSVLLKDFFKKRRTES